MLMGVQWGHRQVPKKVDPQVRVQKRDLEDLIRDEIYGASSISPAIHKIVVLHYKEVAKLAKRIARRAIVGH